MKSEKLMVFRSKYKFKIKIFKFINTSTIILQLYYTNNITLCVSSEILISNDSVNENGFG